MSLHLLRLRPDMPHLVRWARTHHALHERDDEMGYALHAALAAAFGPAAPRPFALLSEPGRPPELLAYSSARAETLREGACPSDVGRAIGLAGMAGQEMPARFDAGRRLRFRLRCRPVVRTDKAGDRRRARERDAFLAAIEGTAPGAGPTREAVYRDWVVARLAAGGAEAEHVAIDSYRRARVYRRRAEDGRRPLHGVEGPDATFTGVLSVRDPELFAALLPRGVGRHRAFGYGMLLLRPC